MSEFGLFSGFYQGGPGMEMCLDVPRTQNRRGGCEVQTVGGGSYMVVTSGGGRRCGRGHGPRMMPCQQNQTVAGLGVSSVPSPFFSQCCTPLPQRVVRGAFFPTMPLLGGLFSRKNKSLRAGDDRSDSLHSTAVSDNDPGPSPTSTASYVHTNRSVPSNPNASNLLHPDSARQIFPYNPPPMMATPTPSSSSSGGSKLRLFGRKKSLAAEAAPSTPEPPRKSFQMAPRPKNDRTSTDTDATDMRRLRPPPSRSAIFAAYGDPNSALSTRSLPNDASHPPTTPFALSPTQPGPPPPPKKSFFGWGKNHPNPPPPLSPSLLDPGYFSNGYDSAGSPTSQDAASFNLRSFRHIRPPSPTGSNVSLTPPVPRPRPRGESVNSDSAQRISVAAFREAQARRSQAGSPSPSFRSTSPAPGLPSGRNSPRPSRSASHVASQQQQRRRSSMALQMTSDSEASASSSEVESEGETAQPGNRTNKALNTPGRTKAKSEIGHGRRAPMASSKSSDFPLHPRVPSSHVGHSSSAAPVPQRRPDENKKSLDAPRPQSTLSVYNSNLRPRASVSTSAITPSSAAKRASIVVAINNRMGNSESLHASRETSINLCQVLERKADHHQ